MSQTKDQLYLNGERTTGQDVRTQNGAAGPDAAGHLAQPPARKGGTEPARTAQE